MAEGHQDRECLPTRATPLLRPHRRFAQDGRAQALRVAAAAAATDGRDLARLREPKACQCGEPEPSRHHLTFDCRLRPWGRDRRSEQERRMLCAIVEDEGFAIPGDEDEAKVGELAGILAAAEDDVLVAAAGGAFLAGEHFRWRAASWAVAVGDDTVSGLVTGEVTGEEKTAAAGEREAFAVLCRAVLLTGRRVKVLLDNLAIVQGARRRATADFVEDELWEFWHGFRQVRELLDIAWIPSHGKRASWLPPGGLQAAERPGGRCGDPAAGGGFSLVQVVGAAHQGGRGLELPSAKCADGGDGTLACGLEEDHGCQDCRDMACEKSTGLAMRLFFHLPCGGRLHRVSVPSSSSTTTIRG